MSGDAFSYLDGVRKRVPVWPSMAVAKNRWCHAYCIASVQGFCTLHLGDMDYVRLPTTVWAQALALANVKKVFVSISFVRVQLLHLRLTRLVPGPQVCVTGYEPSTGHSAGGSCRECGRSSVQTCGANLSAAPA